MQRVELLIVHRERFNGVVFWRGNSAFNGRPIMLVVTGLARATENRKTGDMLQSWVLSDEGQSPAQAVRTGKDVAVCGQCQRMKGGTEPRCYVNVGQAPSAVFDGESGGSYPDYVPSQHDALIRGHLLRMGSYGDPAACPWEVWERLLPLVPGHTGYTHAWKHCDQRFRLACMASCDSPFDRRLASWMGWKTFRVRKRSEPLLPGEFACPGSVEQRNRLTCAQCLACDGGAYNGSMATPCEVEH